MASRYATHHGDVAQVVIPEVLPFMESDELVLNEPAVWTLTVSTLKGIEKKTPVQWQRSDLEFIAKDGAVTDARDRLVNGFVMLHQRDMEVLVSILSDVYPRQIQGVAALMEKASLFTANKQNAEDMELEVVIYKQTDTTITEFQNLRTRRGKAMDALHLVCRETCDERINYAE